MSTFDHLSDELNEALERLKDRVTIPADRIAFRWPIAAYKTTPGFVTTFNIFGSETCADSGLIDVAATGRTGPDGTVRLSLNDFHCVDRPPAAGRNTLGYSSPVNVQVTPMSDTPVHVSARATIDTNVPNDVLIEVSAWDGNGDPADVAFYWPCLVPTHQVIG